MSAAKQYLEQIQRAANLKAYGEEGAREHHARERQFVNDPDNPTLKRSRDFLRQLLGDSPLAAQFSQRPSRAGDQLFPDLMGRYSSQESPIFAHTIDPARRLAESATRTIAEHAHRMNPESPLDLTAIDQIAFGSMPSMLMNAAAIRVPDSDEYVVIVNQGLPQFLARIARVILRAGAVVPMDAFDEIDFSRKDWPKHYQRLVSEALAQPENRYVTDNMLAAIGDYLSVDVGVSYDHRLFASTDRILAEIMTVGAEVFVVAHEFNHILDGHFVHWKEDVLPALATTVAFGSRDTLPEQAADIAGIGAVSLVAREDPARHGFLATQDSFSSWIRRGPQHFFMCSQIIDLFHEALIGPIPDFGTHPPTADRILFMRHLMADNQGEFDIGFQRYNTVAQALMRLCAQRLTERTAQNPPP